MEFTAMMLSWMSRLLWRYTPCHQKFIGPDNGQSSENEEKLIRSGYVDGWMDGCMDVWSSWQNRYINAVAIIRELCMYL
eukprot:scaffold509615_cov20-Prasinocladus_malaysianus.AAC.1